VRRALLVGAACALAVLTSACIEPLVLSRFDTEIGVNWRTRQWRHRGIDVPAPIGTPVLAAAPGQVSRVYFKPTVGWIIMIKHPRHLRITRYLHLGSVSVEEGQTVARGEKIGAVGLFERSVGIQHVHLELWRPTDRGTIAIIDPIPLMAGCASEHPDLGDERFALTYPIACQWHWYSAHRDTEGILAGASAGLEATTGLADQIGIASSGTLRTGPHLWRFRHYLGWDGDLSLGKSGLSVDATARTGIGYGDPYMDVVLSGGIGASRVAGALDSAAHLPLRLLLRVKHRFIWADAWLGARWSLGGDERQHGSNVDALGLDEARGGVSIRFPPLTKTGVTLGIEVQDLGGEQLWRVGLGTSFDTLF
jgi:hypothetical protein